MDKKIISKGNMHIGLKAMPKDFMDMDIEEIDKWLGIDRKRMPADRQCYVEGYPTGQEFIM